MDARLAEDRMRVVNKLDPLVTETEEEKKKGFMCRHCGRMFDNLKLVRGHQKEEHG